MTKNELAAKLHGRSYGKEITTQEETEAKAAGLVVIFGYSDDNAELRGAVDDEIPCFEGGDIYITPDGVLSDHDDDCSCNFCGYDKAKAAALKIEAVWDEEGYSWIYRTDAEHAVFDIIVEDGQKYCRGIVLEMPR